MSKRKLYPTLGTQNKNKSVRNLMNFLQYADGTNSLKSISKSIKINLSTCRKVYKILKKNSLVS